MHRLWEKERETSRERETDGDAQDDGESEKVSITGRRTWKQTKDHLKTLLLEIKSR